MTPTAPILPFREARDLVEDFAHRCRTPERESVPLGDALGRALGQALLADRDLPPFPRSTRDGYAVRTEDLAPLPAHLLLVGEIKAGDSAELFSRTLQPGQAVSIMTGAAVPAGADAVVMVEHASVADSWVTIKRATARGENIVARAAEAHAQDVVVAMGARINHATIAVAAAVGKTTIEVFTRPHVAVLCTGDEVVPIDQTPAPHQIRNSNAHSLAAQVTAAGGVPYLLPIAPDEPEALQKLLAEGLGSSLLLVTGGVSMGKYDFVESALEPFAPQFFFTGALIQPGKPTVFAEALRPGTESAPFRLPVFGLPGNPVSTMVTFELFVRPVLAALCGQRPAPLRFPQARLASDFHGKPGLTRFLPARFTGKGAEIGVELIPWKGSGDVVSAASATCYVVIEPESDNLRAGEVVPILIPGAEL